MAKALDPAVAAQIDTGEIRVLPLIRIDLAGKDGQPGKTVGYHTGGRAMMYSGLEYLPNRWLEPEEINLALGNQVSEITMVFSDVPTANPADAIGAIEDYNYINAPVLISWLAGNPETDEVLGVLDTQAFEIGDVDYVTGEIGEDGLARISINVLLQTPARRLRDRTHAKRSLTEQQYHNDAGDTSLRYVATSPEWPEEWGQR